MTDFIIGKIDSLPPLPKSIIELEEFRKLPNKEILDLLKIIEKDPLIVTTLLRVANSALFGFVSEVETPSRAINLLGVNFTISIILGSAVQDLVKSNLDAYGVQIDDFINTSNLASSLVNQWISKVDFSLREELLLPAFLQETGKFVISEVVNENGKTKEFLEKIKENKNISDIEKEFTGYSCARVTANIFKHWKLSHELIFKIGFVENLDTCPKDYQEEAKVLEIIKILCNIREPLSDKVIEEGVKKAKEYGFDTKILLDAIESIKLKLNNEF